MAFQECGVSGDSDSRQHYTMVFPPFIFPYSFRVLIMLKEFRGSFFCVVLLLLLH